MPDKYRNFRELLHNEPMDSFQILERYGPLRGVSIIAPHAGRIEPGTSQIAHAIADDLINIYCFEGRRPQFNDYLHITSTNFDEPRALKMVGASDYVVTVHGCRDRDSHIYLGGQDEVLIEATKSQLRRSGFQVGVHASPLLQGKSASNICNRGRRGVGVQLEISRDLRDDLVGDGGGVMLSRLGECIRGSILSVVPRVC